MNKRTNITKIDEQLWQWGKKRGIELKFRNTSEYIFSLIKKDKDEYEKTLNKKSIFSFGKKK